MEYTVRETGDYGESARQVLLKFIEEKQETSWKHVALGDEPESPIPPLMSVVTRPDEPGRKPRPRKKKEILSPEILVEPEPICLEEPPRKVSKLTITNSALLQDLACSPSLSTSSSSTASAIEYDTDIEIYSSIETGMTKAHRAHPRGENNGTETVKRKKSLKEGEKKESKRVNETENKENRDKNEVTEKQMDNSSKEAVKTKDKEKKTADKEKKTANGGAKEVGNKKDEDKHETRKVQKRNNEEETEKAKKKDRKTENEQKDRKTENERRDNYVINKETMKENKSDKNKQAEKGKKTDDLKGRNIENDRMNVVETEEGNVKNSEKGKEKKNAEQTELSKGNKSRENQGVAIGNTENEKRVCVDKQSNEKNAKETEKSDEKKCKESQNEDKNRNRNKEIEKQIQTDQQEEVKLDRQSEKNKETQTEQSQKQKDDCSAEQSNKMQQVEEEMITLNDEKNQTEIQGQKNKCNEQDGQIITSRDNRDCDKSKHEMQKEKKTAPKYDAKDGKIDKDKSNKQNKTVTQINKNVNKENLMIWKTQGEKTNECYENEKMNMNTGNDDKMSSKQRKRTKITLKEYESRKERQDGKISEKGNSSRANEMVLDRIMSDITNTFSMQQIKYLVGDNNEQNEICGGDEMYGVDDFNETAFAVASITDQSVEEVVENANTVVGECAYELLELFVIEKGIEEAVEKVSEELVEEQMHEREIKRKRKAEVIENEVENEVQSETSDQTEAESERLLHKESKKRRKIKEKHELQAYLQRIQENKIILNIGGTRFETSKETLTQDPKSLFALLFEDEPPIHPVGNSFFIDRDPAHFRLILNYLRGGCSFSSDAILPRDRRYLLEIKSECEFYHLKGLRRMVKTRLERLSDTHGVE